MDGSRGLTRYLYYGLDTTCCLVGPLPWFGILVWYNFLGQRAWGMIGEGEGGLILGVEFREAGGKVSIGFMVLGNGMGVAGVF